MEPSTGEPLRASADPRPYVSAFDDDGGGKRRFAVVAVALLVLAGLAGGAYYWWRQQPPTEGAVAPLAGREPAPPAPAASAPVPDEPVVKHPIEPPVAAATTPPPPPEQADAALHRALTDLLGQRAVLTMLQTDGFVRRAVVTVDNLGRAHAAPRLWPVVPTAGRFSVQRSGDVETAAPANAARYGAFITFVDSVDVARAAALYKAHYPQFQAAYRELGYPRGYFNDRLVEVIDQLLATPEPTSPPALRLTQVKGPIAAADERPWVRYEYADPKLEALPAGSKMLLRMDPDQARRLKGKLRAFRQAVARN